MAAISVIFTCCRKSSAIQTEQRSITITANANTGSTIDSIKVNGKLLNAAFPLSAGTTGRSITVFSGDLAANASINIYMNLKEGETIRLTDANGKVFEQYMSADLLQVLHLMVGQASSPDPQTGNIEVPDFNVVETNIEFDDAALGYGYFRPVIAIVK